MNGYMKKIGCVILMLVMLAMPMMSGNCAARAEQAGGYGLKYFMNDDPSLVDVDIIDFKVKLYEMGFYSAGVSNETLQTKALDDLTMAAVKQVCKLNPELVYYTDGVSYELYWLVMEMVEGELKTPLDEEYRELLPGEISQEIISVQNRLNQLGYDAVKSTFTPGMYDEELQKVINEFIRCNKFVYQGGDCITKEMQELMFGEDAVMYFAEAEVVDEKALNEKIFAYFGATTAIMGLSLPNIVWLIIGFILLCVIVALIFALTSGGSAPEVKKRLPRKKNQMKTGEVEFRIEYGEDRMVCRKNVMQQYVRIGRETGDFPLNVNDHRISRTHCEICYENGNLMLRDFSHHGTIINGSKCNHSQQALHSGDVIEIGMHRITIIF